ncbi:unnamed protein product [Nippostrongylus brasiliensis]|uniref:Cyclic nucleotide-binding domain-containing protein n=1 Tax=Nippostrongylus brasiliensis TaxID=27835 RepID=A0A158QY65_NIPBR|nr:unnamed protein product [Nippostrongylus brasiliensis]
MGALPKSPKPLEHQTSRIDVNITEQAEMRRSTDEPLTKRSFTDVVRTAMIVRNWMMSTNEEDRASDVNSSLVFEPPIRPENEPILTNTEDVFEAETTGFDILKAKAAEWSRKCFYFYVSPSGYFYYYWTCVVSLGLLYNMMAMVIFIFDDVFLGYFFYWLYMNLFFDCIFLLDILIQSRTIYRINDFIERAQKRTSFPHAFKISLLITACYILFHWNACVYFLFSLSEGLSEDDQGAFGFSYYKVFDPRVPTCSVFNDQNCQYEENFTLLDIDDHRWNYKEAMYSFWSGKFVKWEMGNFSREYSMSIYWSALTITTCGQQPYPSSSPQNMLEVIDTLIGVLVFATIIGGVGSVVTHMNEDVYDFRQKMDGIKFYMKYRMVTPAIQERVVSCFTYMHSQHQLNDEQELLYVLPPRLQGQIAVSLHMETLKKVELFKNPNRMLTAHESMLALTVFVVFTPTSAYDDDVGAFYMELEKLFKEDRTFYMVLIGDKCSAGFLYEVVLRIKQQIYSPNDYLFRAGERAKEMFIVKRGTLRVIDEDSSTPTVTLTDGATFGEMSVILIAGNQLGDHRAVSLRSEGYSDVYILNQDDVSTILQEYPADRERLILNARDMLRSRNLLSEGAVESSDEPLSVLSLEEQLSRMKNQIKDLDGQLNNLYASFNDVSIKMKRRVTAVERVFSRHRRQIKLDCLRGKIRV